MLLSQKPCILVTVMFYKSWDTGKSIGICVKYLRIYMKRWAELN
jgi:hypothetical protein